MNVELVEKEQKRRSQVSFRVAIIAALGLALFAVLMLRLWTLQVVTGDEYLAEANQNRTFEVRVNEPRGRILDRNGDVLVDNRSSIALQLDPARIPIEPDERRKLFTSLSEATGLERSEIRRRYRRQIKSNPPGTPVTIVRDADDEVVFYIQENRGDFPGLDINRVFVRKYPKGTLAAHLLGNVGEVTAEDLEGSGGGDLVAGDQIGKAGVEQVYDSILRGEAGSRRLQVDSVGRIRGRLASTDPVPGDSIRLTLDAKVQEAGESALGNIGLPGAFVAMDVNSGDVVGLGSYPTIDPAIFTRPLSKAQARKLWDEDEGAPMFNRAIAGAYPVGSVFKPITAMAGLDGKFIGESDSIQDGGKVTIAGQTFTNAGSKPHGSVDLRRAMEVSSDVYFYLLGKDMNGGDTLQKWSRDFGIGELTGIDLPGESAGLLPTPEWRNQLFEDEKTDRPWTVGDNVQLAIGQGDLQAAPLQMAVAYAALANKGRILKPSLVQSSEDPAGRLLEEYEPRANRKIQIDPSFRRSIMEGLNRAAQEPEGTSYGVFGGFPVPIAGKTGTAERPPYGDQSWYVALAPFPNPEIVVATTVERGGFGADTAAPVALQILSAYFGKTAEAVDGGAGNIE